MKILMVNGSANQHGCTYTALSEIGAAAQELGVERSLLYKKMRRFGITIQRVLR